MASVAEIEPLSTEFDVPGTESKSVVEKEITALGKVIFEKATVGLKSATQAVVSNVPQMIQELTQEIESGSIKNFNGAINKLNILIDKLGINLRSYDTKLADAVDKFRGKQEKLQQDLARLREEGIKAEINERGTGIKFLTRQEITQREKEYKERERIIADEQQKRLDLVRTIEDTNRSDKDNIKARKDLKKSIEKEQELKEKNAKEGEVLRSTTADTGRDMGGFSKLAELKEAFMVIPDTINEVAGGFAQFGKSLMSGFKQFLFAPLKTIGRLFKTIGNIFRTARALIALKVLAVIAAFQFFAEKIDFIKEKFTGAFTAVLDGITGAFEKVKDFFQGIVDWFKNSAVGKFFGLSGDDSDEPKPKREYRNMDENTYGIGEDGSEIAPTNLVDEFLPQSKDPAAAVVVDPVTNKIIKPGEPGYEKARANRLQTTQSYIADEQEVNAAMNDLRSVVGDNVVDGDEKTSAMLKSLESESNNIKPPTIINVQNNATSNTAQSQSSNVSGFIHHEPDESFKFVRQGNTGSYDF